MKIPRWMDKVLEYFKSRERMRIERDYAWDELDRLRCFLEATSILDFHTLKTAVLEGKDNDPPRVLPGSDIGEGKLRIQHWATKALAHSFYEFVQESPDFSNYLIIPFEDKEKGTGIEIVIQRLGKALTPHEKSQRLEEENAKLKEELEDLANKLQGYEHRGAE